MPPLPDPYRRIIPLIAVVCCAGAAEWPAYHGPSGDFTVPPSQLRLLDDLARAKLRWESAEKDLPVAKLRSSGNPYSRPSGGMGGLVVAGGSLYFAYAMPSGPSAGAGPERKQSGKGSPLDACIAADDVVLAIDAATGATRWKTVFAGKGVNNPPTKRGGAAITPCVGDGMVCWVGSSGRIYALKAADGALAWEADIGPMHQRIEQAKAERLTARDRLVDCPNMEASPFIADGVLVVPTFEATGRGIALAGHDLRSGRRLWRVERATYGQATPALWQHAGRRHILAGNGDGEVRAIDPRDGRVLWTLDGLGRQYQHLVPAGDEVLLNVQAPLADGADGKDEVRYGAFRLAPSGATRLWEMPDDPRYRFPGEGDGRTYRRCHRRGDAWHIMPIGKDGEGAGKARCIVVAAADGAIRSDVVNPELSCHWPMQSWWIDGRCFVDQDAAHCGSRFQWLDVVDGKPVAAGEPWSPLPGKGEGCTAYMVPMQTPVLDGFLYLRTSAGVVRCFDLRADPR